MEFKEALQKLQDTELEILKALASFCAENGIEWFIDSGTVLGACVMAALSLGMTTLMWACCVRTTTASSALSMGGGFTAGYSVHTARNTPGFAGMFAKVYKDGTLFETKETREAGLRQGIFVDIFPYDPISRDPKVEVRQRSRARLWQSISYLYHSRSIVVPHKGILGALERVACWIAHPVVHALFTPENIADKFAHAVSCGSGSASDLMLPFAWPNIKGLPVDVLVPPVPRTFEGIEFPAPAQTARYLEIMYGDWQTLPAPEDRRTHLPQVLDFGNGERWENRDV